MRLGMKKERDEKRKLEHFYYLNKYKGIMVFTIYFQIIKKVTACKIKGVSEMSKTLGSNLNQNQNL